MRENGGWQMQRPLPITQLTVIQLFLYNILLDVLFLYHISIMILHILYLLFLCRSVVDQLSMIKTTHDLSVSS